MNDLIDEIDPEKKAQSDRRSEIEREALRTVLSSRGGRRFLWSLMGKAGIGRNPYTGDDNSTNFNCGRQSIATDLMIDIEAVNPDAYLTMLKEAKEDNAYVNHGNAPQYAEQPRTEQFDSIAAIKSGTL